MIKIVGRLVEGIVFLFGLFGGYLSRIAPPEEADAMRAVGLSSIVSLLLFLGISVLIRWKSSRAHTLLIVIAAVLSVLAVTAGFVYHSKLRDLTFEYPPGSIRAEYIAGTEYTTDAKDYLNTYPATTVSELVAKFGGLGWRDRVWTHDSRKHAANILTVWYVVFIVSVFGSIFCLTEGLLALPPEAVPDAAAQDGHVVPLQRPGDQGQAAAGVTKEGDVTTPDWLKKRGGELKPSKDGRAWLVFFAGEPNYLIEPLPAEGKDTCRVVQTNNGKRLDSGAVYPDRTAAAQGGLEDLRKALGW